MSAKTLKLIKETDAKWVDLRFTDSRGKEQHVSYPASQVGEEFFVEGRMFDGSSFEAWKGINESDMLLMPDDDSAVLDPFTELPTVNIRCSVVDPVTLQGYDRDPRAIAQRAEEYLRSTGIADSALFGPEPEFFVFDGVRWRTEMHASMYQVYSDEGAWMSGAKYDGHNHGHRPRVKGGYFPVPPVDGLHDLRAAMCSAMESMGLEIEVHHHEVATAGQCEIGVGPATLTRKADEVQILKYCVHNVAHAYGKTATFMPKPLLGDSGSGMHVHQSLQKDGRNIFAGDMYGGLSEAALYYIGGIIHHARALNAITNPSTNSYKRLVPGFEAPVKLAYSARNRSAAIRIPYVSSPKGRRIEARFPDAVANPYLCFAALLMAGLDGIQNKIDPGEAMDKDLYGLSPEEALQVPTVAQSLEVAIDALCADHEFLLKGNVFSKDGLEAYISLLRRDVERLQISPHPVEFDMYFSS